jgi:hypothetical protein
MKIGYKVIINSSCDDSEFSDEKWGPWSEDWSHSFGSIHRITPPQYSDVSSDLNILAEEPVYVVWVEYSTGDSFGWANRGRAVAVGVFKTYEDAQALEAWLNNKDKARSYSQTYDSPDGQILQIYCEWEGYFERLESVNITPTVMQPPVSDVS